MIQCFGAILSGVRGIRLGFAGLLLAASFGLAGNAAGQALPFTPLHFSIAPGLQFPSPEIPVWGMRLNLGYAVQPKVFGMDIGIVNVVGENLSGIGVGAFNVANKDATGFQVGGGNSVNGDFRGLQVAFANYNEGNLAGVQVGVGNATHDGFGLQLGLLNQASSLKGVQIGLINLNEGGFLPFFPFINFGF